MSGGATRAVAARSLAAVLRGSTLENALGATQEQVPDRDRALLRELTAGTLRQYPLLKGVLDQLTQRPFRRRDIDLEALCLIGLHQLQDMRTPDHAAVSATVDASAAIGHGRARGMVNAVLRRFIREREGLLAALDPAAAAAMPCWLWDRLGEDWPRQRDAIAGASAEHPPMTLRVNLSRGTRDAYFEELRKAGIAATLCERSTAGITLADARSVTELPGFDAGRCSVQDETAQLAAALLAPQPGKRILDGCAAPGGKTGHLLEMEDALELVACDVSAERLVRVEENLSRLGLSATLITADLRDPGADLQALAPFDAVLLDVPCSATGVIRRHPDIKVLRREEDIPGFAQQQAQLLASSWELLKPGGRLLYVTCSVLKAENSDVIAAFLAGADDAAEAALECNGAERCAHGVQYLPQPGAGDGLYFALLRKTL